LRRLSQSWGGLEKPIPRPTEIKTRDYQKSHTICQFSAFVHKWLSDIAEKSLWHISLRQKRQAVYLFLINQLVISWYSTFSYSFRKIYNLLNIHVWASEGLRLYFYITTHGKPKSNISNYTFWVFNIKVIIQYFNVIFRRYKTCKNITLQIRALEVT
jgi:hypothetical protein